MRGWEGARGSETLGREPLSKDCLVGSGRWPISVPLPWRARPEGQVFIVYIFIQNAIRIAYHSAT